MENIYDKEKLDSQNYSCSNCGAKIEFNPSSQKLKCPYCGSITEIETTGGFVADKQIDDLIKNASVWNETEIMQCSNCGSKEILKKGEISTSCSFCGTTNIVKTSEIVGMKPHGICPFQKSPEEATSNVRAWVKKKVFAPKSFKQEAVIKSLKGVYSPAFTFDCDTSTKYDGELADDETYTVRGRDGKMETKTKTRYFKIHGNYKRVFDDLAVHASSSIPSISLSSIEPFPTNQCIPYNEKYLAGYTANTYSKDGKQTWEECQSSIKNIVRREILNGYHYDRVCYFNAKTTYHSTSFKYVLLPVYVGHNKYKNKNYNFYVNGATGKVTGKFPVSVWKVLFLILGILAFISIPVLLSIMFGS